MTAFTSNPVVLSGDGRAAGDVHGNVRLRRTGSRWSGHSRSSAATSPPADDAPGAQAVILLGASTWESRYARDADVVGRPVTVNGAPAVVIGVVSERLRVSDIGSGLASAVDDSRAQKISRETPDR